jgi:hypothetical protein
MPGGNRSLSSARRPPLATVPPSPSGAQHELAISSTLVAIGAIATRWRTGVPVSDDGVELPLMPVVYCQCGLCDHVGSRIVDQSLKAIIRLPINGVDRHTAHAARE